MMDYRALRKPEQIMRLQRLGSFHQTRLSFMRVVLRRLKKERWQFSRPMWQIDDQGVGVALYSATSPTHTYSLICFAHDLPAEKRSDRVIAEQWDATFTLYDGVPSEADIKRLSEHVPRQEAGRYSAKELVLSRANRSVRLFEYVVECLAAGQQPELEQLTAIGYLMRTTAVYGNGKFGLCDRDRYSDRQELAGPFRAELLAVWLIRAFSVDIAEHLAHSQTGQQAVKLDPNLRRRLGVGNATGLGMAPFLINHPVLLHRWIAAREQALARVLALTETSAQSLQCFHHILARAQRGVAEWHTSDQRQSRRIAQLNDDLAQLSAHSKQLLKQAYPWQALYRWSEQHLSPEGQELSISLSLEPHGALIDDLAEQMAADEYAYFAIDGTMRIGQCCQLINNYYQWALEIDFTQAPQRARFWYVSEEKLEPRLGERFQEPGAELEQKLAVAHDVAALYADLKQADSEQTIASFLLHHPEHRHSCRRVQLVAQLPYADIRDNLIAADLLPLDMLRCKLSFFGASKFDPRSDRWLRITMYQDAPFPDELHEHSADDWSYPPLENIS